MKHPSIRSISLALVVAAFGCGGGSKGSTPPPSAADRSAGASGALSAHLADRFSADAASTAVVSLAVFGPDAPPDAAEIESEVEGFGAPWELNDFARKVKRRDDLLYVPAPVDAALPLSVESIAAAAGEAAPAVRGARSVVFVRYAGRPVEDEAHLRAASLSALALAAGEGHAIVDLGNRRVFTPEAWAQFLASEDWLAQQVVVDAEQGDDGTVTFYTRGMARFGQPDLEESGVPQAEARARFERFQAVFRALRARGTTKVGDVVDGVTLRPCTRPPEAIEHACVAM